MTFFFFKLIVLRFASQSYALPCTARALRKKVVDCQCCILCCVQSCRFAALPSLLTQVPVCVCSLLFLPLLFLSHSPFPFSLLPSLFSPSIAGFLVLVLCLLRFFLWVRLRSFSFFSFTIPRYWLLHPSFLSSLSVTHAASRSGSWRCRR